jgi:hypothetical protein
MNPEKLQKLQTSVLMMYAASQLQLEALDVLKETQFYNQSRKNLLNNVVRVFERDLADFHLRYINNDTGVEIIDGREYSKGVAFNTVQQVIEICVKELSSLRPGEVPHFAAIVGNWRDVKEVADETYQAL